MRTITRHNVNVTLVNPHVKECREAQLGSYIAVLRSGACYGKELFLGFVIFEWLVPSFLLSVGSDKAETPTSCAPPTKHNVDVTLLREAQLGGYIALLRSGACYGATLLSTSRTRQTYRPSVC